MRTPMLLTTLLFSFNTLASGDLIGQLGDQSNNSRALTQALEQNAILKETHQEILRGLKQSSSRFETDFPDFSVKQKPAMTLENVLKENANLQQAIDLLETLKNPSNSKPSGTGRSRFDSSW